MENIKIIFVDIDWTILNHEIHDWDYESLDALKQAQKNGVLVYLCTARPYDSVYHTGIFDYLVPDGMITTNGAVAFVKDKVLYANNVPEKIVEEVENIANKHGLILEFSTEKERYFTGPSNKYVEDYFKVFWEIIPPIRTNEHKHVSAMLLFAPKEMDEMLIKELPNCLNYYRYDANGVDLGYFANDKGKGIRRVLSSLKIKKENAMGIGDDDYGDIPMFEEVGVSIAMGNGKDKAKEVATHVAETIHEHGLALKLKELGII